MYISKDDLKDLDALKAKKENLAKEKYILECKVDGLRDGINDIDKAIDKKTIEDELNKKGISEKGQKVELRYSNGTWFGVTMGMDEGYWVGLRVHLMLKSRKGWYKESTTIRAVQISVIQKATTDFPDSPKLNEDE